MIDRRALLLLVLPLALAACGKEGDIKVPEDKAAAYQRHVYPNPTTVVPGPATLQPPPTREYEEFGDERTTKTIYRSE